MPTISEGLTQIYTGYFNRAPDPAGLNYWVGRANGGMSLTAIASSFSVQPEATTLYWTCPERVEGLSTLSGQVHKRKTLETRRLQYRK